jgi:hypothetical protein
MNGIFINYLDKFSIVFLDDILIYSKSKEEHEQLLRMVLQVLRENQVYVKLRTCYFLSKADPYHLEHIISKEGIAID